jgi:hypothetical protein
MIHMCTNPWRIKDVSHLFLKILCAWLINGIYQELRTLVRFRGRKYIHFVLKLPPKSAAVIKGQLTVATSTTVRDPTDQEQKILLITDGRQRATGNWGTTVCQI